MKDADAAPSSGDGKLKHAGDKAFLLRNGVWTDTTFVPEKMATYMIGELTKRGYTDRHDVRPRKNDDDENSIRQRAVF